MAQHDMNIINAGFPAVRSDINSALSAIQTNHSGTSRPSGAVAGQIWLDTTSATNPTLKFFDGTDDISLATIDYSANTVNWLDSTVSADLIGDTSPQLGGMLDINGNAIGDGVLELLKFIETVSAVNELTITNSATANAPELSSTGDDTNIDIKITPKGSGNVVLDGIKFPNADGTADQVLKTDGSGNLSFTDVSGGISWQSSIVTTSTLTAVVNEGYWIDTTSNACTVTLPASASVGDQIIFVDYARNWGTNAVTLDQNSLNYQGGTDNPVYDTNGQTVNIVYSGATNGWIPISDDDVVDEGTIPPVDFLVIAGGGGAGGVRGGGGGAGGYRASSQNVSSGITITVTVGNGGSGGNGAVPSASSSTNGSDSSISGTGLTTITSTGGGGGASTNGYTAAGSGGSGGGGVTDGGGGAGASGNTPSTSPSQGNNGGSGDADNNGAGGGGGASAVGQDGISGTAGNGGAGTASSITGSSVTRGGGGGGGAYVQGGGIAGSGGSGGGGAGSISGVGTAGTTNTGGGGGGGKFDGTGGGGGNGGSGVVILSMLTSVYTGTTTGSPTVATSGTKTILTFTGSGSYTH
jgi:hypothetical protein